jgi:hypothetical protein
MHGSSYIHSDCMSFDASTALLCCLCIPGMLQSAAARNEAAASPDAGGADQRAADQGTSQGDGGSKK